MYRRCRFLCYASAASSSRSGAWDPTVSLDLKHPSLFMLETCAAREHFRQILAHMIRADLVCQTFPMSRLLHFSAVLHPENLPTALLLFKHFTPNPNLYIYNTMISAVSASPGESFALYKSMLRRGLRPDKHTLLALVKSSDCFLGGKQIHAHVVVAGYWGHQYLQNSLAKMYADVGRLGMADNVFMHMSQQDRISYNIMISGYARSGCHLDAIEMFRQMRLSGLEPDQFTISGLLVCSGHLRDIFGGKTIHAWLIRRELFEDWGLILSNTLLDMYVKCEEVGVALRLFECIKNKDIVSWNTLIAGFANKGDLDHALWIFNEMPDRDLVSWNSLICGYAQTGSWKTVLKVFNDMLAENVKPNKVTAIVMVGAASETGSLNHGRSTHGWVVKNLTNLDAFLGCALIDMYCKCGSIEKSLAVFESIPERDIAVWTSMIIGLAFHGHGTKAMEVFQVMQDEGLKPNEVTLVAVLTACTHAGLVDQGRKVFDRMKESYGFEPGVEHYGCLVDLLARAGRLSEAESLIKNMPLCPTRSMWGALLTASKAQGNVEFAISASRKLLKLEPKEEVGYVLLSNAYAASGWWSHSDKIRKIMETRGLRKTAAYSSLVVDGAAHEFVASDKLHPRWSEIYDMLTVLNKEAQSAEKILLNCSVIS